MVEAQAYDPDNASVGIGEHSDTPFFKEVQLAILQEIAQATLMLHAEGLEAVAGLPMAYAERQAHSVGIDILDEAEGLVLIPLSHLRFPLAALRSHLGERMEIVFRQD